MPLLSSSASLIEMISSPSTTDDAYSYISDGSSITSSGEESTDSSSFAKILRSSMMKGIGGFYSQHISSPNNCTTLSKNAPTDDDNLSTTSSHTEKSDFSQRTPIPTSSAPLEGLPNTPLGRNRSSNNSSQIKAIPSIVFHSDEEDASRVARRMRQDVNIDRLVVAAKQQQSFAQAWFAAASSALSMNALPAYSPHKRKSEVCKATKAVNIQKHEPAEPVGHPVVKGESIASANRPIDMDSGDVWSQSSTISSCYSSSTFKRRLLDVPFLHRLCLLFRLFCTTCLCNASPSEEEDASKKKSFYTKYKRAFLAFLSLVIVVAISLGIIIHPRSLHSVVALHTPSIAPTLSPRNQPFRGQTDPLQLGNATSSSMPTRAPSPLLLAKPSLSPSRRPTFNISSIVWSQVGPSLNGFNRTDQFGYSVSLNENGSILAVGARHYLDSRTFNGAAFVYRIKRDMFQGILWEPMGQILTGRNALDEFGYSVSLSEDGLTLAVSEPVYTNGTIKNCGGVRVFRFDSNLQSWYQLGGDLYGQTSFEYFGTSVSLSADGLVVAIGSPYFGPFKSGCVRIFRYVANSNIWAQLGLDLMSSNPYDNFGRDVSISGDGLMVACGVPNNSNGGYVRVYRWDYSMIRWMQYGVDIRNNSSTAASNFGWSVSLSYNGGRLIVGEPNVQVQGLSASGSASIYSWNDTDASWLKNGDDFIGDPRLNQIFGLSVSISRDGTQVAIGAPSNDVGGYLSGQVSIYHWLNNNSWSRSPPLFGETSKEQFGWDIQLSANGEMVAIGSPAMWDNLQSGKAKVYSMMMYGG